jgi:cell division protein ZapA
MKDAAANTSVEIMGKTYQIKCPAAETHFLQQAAQYLEEKMRLMREAGVLSLDRIAIITALNVAHQLLLLEQQKNQHLQRINVRLNDLQNKVEQALGLVEE